MASKIIIKEQDNKGISILHVLKTLYSDGSEIKSLEDIEKFMDKYHENGFVKIYLDDNCIDSIRFICENNNVTYTIE